MDKIPTISAIEAYINPITILSPSSFCNAEEGCILCFVLNCNVPKRLLTPSHRNALLGTIAHKLFELRKKGQIPDKSTFKATWKRMTSMVEAEIKRDFPSLKNFTLANFELLMHAWKIAQLIEPTSHPFSQYTQGQSCFGTEKYVSLQNILRGKIDSVNRYTDGAEIVDYKTGKILDENDKIKDEYVIQLNLYALMFESTFNIQVKKLTIIDKDGVFWDVKRSNISIEEVISKSQDILGTINHLVSIGSYENITKLDEDCKYCNCRHLCPMFFQTYSGKEILKGTVIDAPNNNILHISNALDGHCVTINNFETLNFNLSEYVGKKLILLNLYQRDNLPFSISDYTLIFCEDDK